nr:hypothetical protein [Tanacetum cinerariifolium]
MLIQQGEGSGTPTEPHHTLSPEVTSSHPSTSSIPLSSIPTALIPPVTQTNTTPIIQYTRRARITQTYNFSKMIFDGMVKNINNKTSKFLMYPRIVPIFDTMLEHQGEGSCTPTEPHHTPSPESFALPIVADEPASPVRDVSEGEACPTESGFIADQDRAAITKSSTLPHDSAPRVTSPTADKGNAATVLAGGIDVPTSSGSIPTAGPPATVISIGSEVGPTDSLIATRKKGKEIMVESDTPKKKKLQEQIDA